MKVSCLLLFLLASTGCTYLHNRADDLADIFILGIGGTAAAGEPFPPGFGLYLEATELFHLGGMSFRGGMAEVDRRAIGLALVKEEKRFGFGPLQCWKIDQESRTANAYKRGDMRKWEERMGTYGIEVDRWFSRETDLCPGKRVTFHGERTWRFHRGWHDWGVVAVDGAISEPFIFHIGVRGKVGLDFSQLFDFLIGIICLDLYGDDATREEYLEAGSATHAASPPLSG